MDATFDPTGTYRYALWREWDAAAPRISFIMLNPSTADAERDDPTIRRCVSFARQWGYGAIEVLNLFAYRTPNPQALRHAVDPIGADNDRHLVAASQRSQTLILAWGSWGSLLQRDRAVLRLFDRDEVYCLGTTQSGQPRHPLYLSRTTVPLPFQRS